MARTSPAPNIPPIPGMCPGVAVLGGGGGGGGAGGKGSKKGKGKKGAGKKKGKKGAKGGKKKGKCGGGSKGKCSKCSTSVPRGDPVDVGTGAVFTNEVVDLALPGPLPLEFARHYESANADVDFGLGFGWSHSFAHRLAVGRGSIEYFDEDGALTEFPRLSDGEQALGAGGILRRDGDRYVFDTLEDRYLHFERVAGQDDHVLVAIVDNNHNRIELSWDASGLGRVVDSAGRVITVGRAGDRVAALVVENAPLPGERHLAARYVHDEHGNLVACSDANGATTRYTYDQDHYLLSETPPDGLTFHFVYDHLHRCIESWGAYPDGSLPGLASSAPAVLADGHPAKGLLHIRLDYLGDGYVEVADSQTVQRYFFDEHGNITKSVSGDTVSERLYDAAGHLMAYSDALGARTEWDRDRFGRIVTETSPRGNVTTTERDESGRVSRVFDALGTIAEIRRDARGNPVERVMSLGDVTRVQYDARGLVTEDWYPDGTRTWYEYDPHGNCTAVTHHHGARWQYTYDALGRMLSATTPVGSTDRWTYDACGYVTQAQYADGSVVTFEYDARGNLARRIDGDGRTLELSYNGRDQVVAVRLPDGSSARYEYDREENLVAVHNERGEVRRLVHNVNGDVVGVESFDGRRKDCQHDANGEVIGHEGAAGRVTFVRGVDGQIEQVEYPDGTAAEFGYDVRGRLLRAAGESNGRPWETIYERNAAGFVVREAQIFAGQAELIERAYDPMRKSAGLTSSRGHRVAIERDELGLLRALRADGASVEVVRDAVGREVRRLLGEGAIEHLWDDNGHLRRRRVVAGVPRGLRGEPDWRGERNEGVLVDKTFQYSPGGQLVSRSDLGDAGREYAHDRRARLTEVRQGNDVVESYWHDEASNVHETSTPRTYDQGNVLSRRGDTDYHWDGDGRLVEKVRKTPDGAIERWRYGWDGQGNLASVERPDGLRVEFFYDAFCRRLGKRVTRDDDGERRLIRSCRYVWDDDQILHEVRAESEGVRTIVQRTFVYDDDGAPLGHHEVRSPEGGASEDLGWLYYVLDNRDAPEQLVGADGQVVGQIQHTAYGLATTAGRTTPLRLRGQFADEETGLHYNRYRYYDPEVGRFISQDPAGGLPDPNLYRYTHNPLISYDQLGLHEAFGWFTPGDKTTPTSLNGGQAYDSSGGITGAQSEVQGIGKKFGDKGAENYGGKKGDNPRTIHNKYRPGDTERQILRDVNKSTTKDQRDGGKLEILGQARPCKRCRTAMARWAKKNNATVTYKYTGQPHQEGAKGSGSGVFTVGPSGKPDWKENPKKKAAAISADTKDPRAAFDNITTGQNAKQMGGKDGGVNPKDVNAKDHYTDF